MIHNYDLVELSNIQLLDKIAITEMTTIIRESIPSFANFNFPSEEFPFKIRLNFIYDLNEVEWQNVLLHEMIHIWEYTMGYNGGHGKLFRMKAKEINDIGGWGITCTHKNILENLKYARDRENN